MANSDKRKQSLYFPEEMLEEIKREAERQDRSLSWIVQKAWNIAKTDIAKYPSVNEDAVVRQTTPGIASRSFNRNAAIA